LKLRRFSRRPSRRRKTGNLKSTRSRIISTEPIRIRNGWGDSQALSRQTASEECLVLSRDHPLARSANKERAHRGVNQTGSRALKTWFILSRRIDVKYVAHPVDVMKITMRGDLRS